jgi:ATP-binding cassette subfamily A (ABC1) protein 3
MIVAFLVTATIGVFQENGFSTFEQLGRIFLLLCMFGFAVLPFLYIAAFLFQSPASGFTKMSIIFIFCGPAMYTVVFSMRFDGFNLKDLADKMTWFFLAVPHFSLSNALTNLNLINVFKEVCNQQCNLLGICDKKSQCDFNPRCCGKQFFNQGLVTKDFKILIFIRSRLFCMEGTRNGTKFALFHPCWNRNIHHFVPH